MFDNKQTRLNSLIIRILEAGGTRVCSDYRFARIRTVYVFVSTRPWHARRVVKVREINRVQHARTILLLFIRRYPLLRVSRSPYDDDAARLKKSRRRRRRRRSRCE